jgi:hypothetical protein
MAAHQIEVGVLVSRRALTSPWGGVSWRPFGIVLDMPPIPAWTKLRSGEGSEIWYAGTGRIALHPGETAHYRDNLALEQPSVWIALRPEGDDHGEVIGLTVDPYEGEAFADSIGDAVEAVPMPEAVRHWVADYVATHHVERPFFKRQRDRVDPETFSRPMQAKTPEDPS